MLPSVSAFADQFPPTVDDVVLCFCHEDGNLLLQTQVASTCLWSEGLGSFEELEFDRGVSAFILQLPEQGGQSGFLSIIPVSESCIVVVEPGFELWLTDPKVVMVNYSSCLDGCHVQLVSLETLTPNWAAGNPIFAAAHFGGGCLLSSLIILQNSLIVGFDDGGHIGGAGITDFAVILVEHFVKPGTLGEMLENQFVELFGNVGFDSKRVRRIKPGNIPASVLFIYFRTVGRNVGGREFHLRDMACSSEGVLKPGELLFEDSLITGDL